MKYIDAEKLIAEIERLRKEARENALNARKNNNTLVCAVWAGKENTYIEVLSFITYLQHEQPEVDIEKEYTEFVVADPVYSKLVNDIVGKSIARHFYELGLNARKEE